MKSSDPNSLPVEIRKATEEYKSTIQKIIETLQNPVSPRHFNDIRALIDRLEELDRYLSSSEVVRIALDIPENG
ncbi:MAG: hypothetical protein K8F90_19965 [Hyphomicrobiales bacterium]|nr:hypothetical protein [Hyphomicrobiales bacterium]